MAFIVDLMNEGMKDEVVYLTISYDFVPGSPAGFDDMKPVWYDSSPPKEKSNKLILWWQV